GGRSHRRRRTNGADACVRAPAGRHPCEGARAIAEADRTVESTRAGGTSGRFARASGAARTVRGPPARSRRFHLRDVSLRWHPDRRTTTQWEPAEVSLRSTGGHRASAGRAGRRTLATAGRRSSVDRFSVLTVDG